MIYMVCVLIGSMVCRWVVIFLVVLFVNVMVSIFEGDMCVFWISYVMWVVNMCVLLLFVFVRISVVLLGSVMVVCCLGFRLVSRLDMWEEFW